MGEPRELGPSRRHDEREPGGFGGSDTWGKKIDTCDFDPPLKK